MTRAIVTIAAVVLAAGTGSAVTHGKTIYVDPDAAGAKNGTSWADAYKFLQDALADANSSEKPVEIRLAQGVYKPDRKAAEPNGTGERMATFRLINGVALQGGYAGFGQPDPNARDIALYGTVLSGDLDANDVDVNDPADLRDEPSRGENSYHVVTARDSDESAVLDGIKITGGNANGVWPNPWPYEERGGGMCNEGGGMYNEQSSPMLTGCVFTGNSAPTGGGMFNGDSDPVVGFCTFVSNSADSEGGGIYNDWSSPTINGCLFSKNSAESSGGGMANRYGSPLVEDCIFSENCTGIGGGIYNSQSNSTIIRCVFVGNSCNGMGAGMWNSRSDAILPCVPRQLNDWQAQKLP